MTVLEKYMIGLITSEEVLDRTVADKGPLAAKLERIGITDNELGEFIVDGDAAVIRAACRRLADAG